MAQDQGGRAGARSDLPLHGERAICLLRGQHRRGPRCFQTPRWGGFVRQPARHVPPPPLQQDLPRGWRIRACDEGHWLTPTATFASERLVLASGPFGAALAPGSILAGKNGPYAARTATP